MSGYQVRSAEIEAALRDVADTIKPVVPTGWGFMVMIFSYGRTGLPNEGTEGSMFYISSAERDNMIEAMKEFIAKNKH